MPELICVMPAVANGRILIAARTLRRILIPCLAACALAHGSLAASDTASLETAWNKAAKLLTNEALIEFESIREAGGADAREAQFGVALMLLKVQPKTEGNIQRAAELFDQVAAQGADNLSALAMYYRARVEQVHRYEPAPDKAAALFTTLIEKYPQHPVAQGAVVKRALISVYDESALEVKRDRLASLEQAAEALTDASARRDLHLVVADSYARLFNDDERALANLLAADRIGITRSKSRAHVWVRIGSLAERTGKLEVAADYYRRFLDKYQRDNRHFTIAQRMKNLGATGAE